VLLSAALVVSLAGGGYFAVSLATGASIVNWTADGTDSARHLDTGSALIAVQPAPASPVATPRPTKTNPLTGAPSPNPPKPTQKPAPTSAKPRPPASQSTVGTLLAQINNLRAQHGLPAYTLLNGLIASAHKHNLQMMGSCGMSHQCPGEAPLGDRISAQGVQWSACGENIGYSGPHPDTTSAIIAAAEGLTTAMYNETPPDDGHRLNLLSSQFHHIGIDVISDSAGRVWLTQDFSN
jgi:uncharacterized protein YkwD